MGREDRKRSVALQHGARPGRSGARLVGWRLVDARRRTYLGDRFVRSRTESHVLGHRKSGTGLGRRRTPWRQPVQLLGNRARSRYGHAEVALSVLAAQRVRLGLDADSR